MIKRIISAAILIPIVVYGVLKADFFYVKIVLLFVASLGYAEWIGMDSKPFGFKKSLYLSLYFLLAFVFLFYGAFFKEALFFAFIMHMIIGFGSLKNRSVLEDYFYFGGILYVFLYFFSVYVMEFENGRLLLLLIFVSIWSGDSFAYFLGKKYGKRKLSPTISPKKTKEGALAGIVGGVVLGVLFGEAIGIGMFDSFLVAFVSNIAGILGDLSESVIKRYFNKKDSSNLIPGHGGVLDRLDSFAFGVFFVYLVLRCRTFLF
ncbi:phosphatidate cytidylyltransferase [Hippea alviniae]|uniref:phosphatidate cytidylyltransferase n=1 Tax=Hippea alviniae TaxID=1279027 RepID=UPI0003B56408|nr:phosphatidate cytidylyltransferase [Hippea alviniae]